MSRYERFFKTLCEVSRAFATAQSSEDLPERVVEKAVDTMGVMAVCLFLADEEEGVFVMKAQKGLSESYFRSGPFRVDRFLPVIERDGFLFAPDATADPRLEGHEAKKAEGISSLLSVPVRAAGRLIGFLSLYTAEPRTFSPEEIEFVTALAEQGATAIERARLTERILANITLFLDVLTKINASLDIKAILQALTEDAARAFRVKAASIRLLDEDRRELVLVASYGLSGKYLDKGPISSEKSIARALTGEPVVVTDAATDPGVQYRDEKREEGIVSILCVPIRAKDRVIGAMRLYSATRRDFREDEIMLATALAQQGGLAIQNANLYMMLQHDMNDLRNDMRINRSWF